MATLTIDDIRTDNDLWETFMGPTSRNSEEGRFASREDAEEYIRYQLEELYPTHALTANEIEDAAERLRQMGTQ